MYIAITAICVTAKVKESSSDKTSLFKEALFKKKIIPIFFPFNKFTYNYHIENIIIIIIDSFWKKMRQWQGEIFEKRQQPQKQRQLKPKVNSTFSFGCIFASFQPPVQVQPLPFQRKLRLRRHFLRPLLKKSVLNKTKKLKTKRKPVLLTS